MSRLSGLLDRLPRTTLLVGKGGVGKTTCATRVATDFAARGETTLLLSTDPAAALADALGAPVGSEISHVRSHLDAWQLHAAVLRRDFLGQWRDVIAEIVDRGTYLDRADVDGLVDAALPGADEIFALLALADVLADPATPYARIVVDTAPTGHTLRLLALPDTFGALLSMLDLMQGKHRFMVRALTHRYRRDRADAFLDDMRERIDRLRATLADASSLAAVLVTRLEPMVQAESGRYLESLRALGVRVAAIVVNAVPPGADGDVLDASVPHVEIPRWQLPMVEAPDAHDTVTAMPAARTLTIVGGKGGVGKSTVSCAIAIAAAEKGIGDVLLVSTDPAASLADALGESGTAWARSDVESRIADVPGLVVRQMDAGAAFARIRDEYRTRIDDLFAALVGRGVDVEHDRAILRDLLALAPPGIDELFALSLLGDALDEQRFACVVVDPAPTGHLLRLLDMPAIALDWTHRLMRLMLKYRDAMPLGDAAQDLLGFAKRTRALDALLHDRERCGVIVVALDEPIVRAETERLSRAIQSRGIDVAALVWNRVTNVPDPLPATVVAQQFFAEEIAPPPIGAAAIRAWSHSWRIFSTHTQS
ncbi:MAG TPA: ArsA family ATPase [Gemmatimonadaceae bacterium]|nr:ArsA family ATPase [Gemmatimonadaceae bacterium]